MTSRWPPQTVRFHAGYTVDHTTGCHLWDRAVNNRGYGVTWFDGKLRLAHRVAWFLKHGAWPPEGLVLDHIACDTKRCVNADHLEATTSAANVKRSPLFYGRRTFTHCRNGHPYQSVGTDAPRVCGECKAAREA